MPGSTWKNRYFLRSRRAPDEKERWVRIETDSVLIIINPPTHTKKKKRKKEVSFTAHVTRQLLYVWRELNYTTITSVEELETLHVGKKPRASHHRSPLGGRRRKRKCSTIFLKRRSKATVNQTNTATVSNAALGRNFLKSGTHMDSPERICTILNWTELNLPIHITG